MAHDAFISYAHDDRAVADRLCEKLEAAGIACWIAPRDPLPGLPYGAQIVQAIAQSRVELLLFSGAANRSRAVLGEVELAANRGKPIVPIRIEDVEPADELEYYIRAVQWFDATRAPLANRLDAVIDVVRGILGAAPARVAAAGRKQNNLPSPVTSFVGRETEAAEIAALLEQHRLVTLAGSAGVGKTRTSLAVATKQLDAFAQGVWFVEFAALSDGGYLPSTIGQAMGLALPADGDPIENLVEALAPMQALLVLDNCEHLLESVSRVAGAILRGCPDIKIMASSRQPLRVAGEQTYRLAPLGLPAVAGDVALARDDAARYPAIALFAERALAADRLFTLSNENASLVAEICRRLDGIPFAIELAAARVTVLGLAKLRDRLDERFRILTAGRRDVLPRQQTLRATIDWSYELLESGERELFQRLGVFVNGFTLEGAVAVAGSVPDELESIEALSSLVDKSLVLVEAADDAPRYWLLESTRAYALEKLAAAGERERSAAAHLRYFRDRFANARERFETTGRGAELERTLGAELQDVRAALDWASSGADILSGGELLAATGTTWGRLGLNLEALARIETFLSLLSDEDPSLLTNLWIAAARLAASAARAVPALEASAQAVAQARRSNDAALLADALSALTTSAIRLSKFDEADAALREAETLPGVLARTRLRLLDARSYLAAERGDRAGALRAQEQLCAEYRNLGDATSERAAIVNLAEMHHESGQTREAVARLTGVLPDFRASNDRARLGSVLANLAGYLAALDDAAGAGAAAREAISELSTAAVGGPGLGVALEHFALALALRGEFGRAATLAGFVASAQGGETFDLGFTERTTHDRVTHLLREQLAPQELEALLARGARLGLEDALAEALAAD